MEISVIIPTYNRFSQLKRCLASLATQDYPADRFEIIVIDDGSRDRAGQTKDVCRKAKHVKYITARNKGRSAARNLGIKNAAGDIIAFIDDDCVVARDWISQIASLYKTYPDIQIIQGRINSVPTLNPIRKIQEIGFRMLRENCVTNKNAFFFGSNNASIRKANIFSHDLFFDEDLETRDDIDLYYRIKKAGLDIIYSDEVAVIHLCQCSLSAFFKRYLGYGRGEYHLRKKWKMEYYPIIPKPLVLSKLVKWHGLFWGLTMWFVIWARNRIVRLGFQYESFKYGR